MTRKRQLTVAWIAVAYVLVLLSRAFAHEGIIAWLFGFFSACVAFIAYLAFASVTPKERKP